MKYSSNRILPIDVYSPEQVKQNEAKAAETAGLSLFNLMEQAGAAVFELVSVSKIKPSKLCVVVGKGNNAGDGFITAALAAKAGWQVDLAVMPSCDIWHGDAEKARQLSLEQNGIYWTQASQVDFATYDIVVDAIIGTGLQKKLIEEWQQVIQNINQQAKSVISIDVPTGLNAATGEALGETIKANQTVTFIGLKSGLLTADAPDYIGRLFFAGLSVDETFAKQNKAYYQIVELNQIKHLLKPRKRNSHKGTFGHLVCIGGDKGMSGAIKLTAEAALRTGAGKVTVLTHPDNVNLVAASSPELIVYGVNGITSEVKRLVAAADAIAIGPGLGKTGWANGLMQLIAESDVAKVVDADGINWLAEHKLKNQNWILTPHPTEAARLLDQSTANIQANRFATAVEIQAKYGGSVILKGCGSLIASYQRVAICRQGNPGMAAAGMGDLLTGIVGALLAQGFRQDVAAELATCIHAEAGDLAAIDGERGMKASDLLPKVRKLVNQAV
ncbi:bifunctional ADP-dependent NAD(P)H-hydrate dehydratase/NAD(P)H-hydrate epimerase [Catenovulum maritimum]|uniref:Bifunctional NAD(P)H-hydrate repair enzyme n=1 Tax=Catenovulum maritimum TaxID=1513271 RepID=A0A0J8GUP2_9ALTE|nr:bifunctional ADP-dependent NAD(P)H-hydrate dehydratase/NAD(P)H-hydrate epimerase [Catenovulum maritimum]KMT64408.1 hypothetical protein XM47_14620 [Catenovulum maritimum]